MRAQAVRPGLPARHRAAGAWSAPTALVLLALALLAAGLLYVRQASAVGTGGYDVLRLEAERVRWEIKNQQLRYRAAELSSLARVDEIARDRLHMGPPGAVVYLEAR